jgi:hypothetical protein
MGHERASQDSPVRHLMGATGGPDYRSFGTLVEAQAHPDGCVVLEGDDGGQIYAVFPAHEVLCGQPTLETLLRDLDSICWPGNDLDSACVFFEAQPLGTPVIGGMGGGIVQDGGWIHPNLVALGLAEEIFAVARGSQERLSERARALRQP